MTLTDRSAAKIATIAELPKLAIEEQHFENQRSGDGERDSQSLDT
jgi:hypothetical protein